MAESVDYRVWPSLAVLDWIRMKLQLQSVQLVKFKITIDHSCGCKIDKLTLWKRMAKHMVFDADGVLQIRELEKKYARISAFADSSQSDAARAMAIGYPCILPICLPPSRNRLKSLRSERFPLGMRINLSHLVGYQQSCAVAQRQ